MVETQTGDTPQDSTAQSVSVKPTGPAQLVNQFNRSSFALKVGEDTIFSATVRVLREGMLLTFKEAGARLFTLSRSDGWNQVDQTVRVAGIGLLAGDTLHLKGTVTGIDLVPLTMRTQVGGEDKGMEATRSLWCKDGDWIISVDDDHTDLTVSTRSVNKAALVAQSTEIVIRYRPRVSEQL